MSILVEDLVSRLESALDAEGSDHYSLDRDYIPSINSAINWLISVINSSLGNKKLGEEIFRELKVVEVHTASRDSRISLRNFEYEPWTILAVYLKITSRQYDGSINVASPLAESVRRPDLYHVSSNDSAKRLTIEEWATNTGNPFAAGYNASCSEATTFAYLDPFRYHSPNDGGLNSVKEEIEVRPSIAEENVTVFYVRKPEPIQASGDTIPFPDSVFSILFNKALQYISYKQGDQTNVYTVTAQDVALLTRTIL